MSESRITLPAPSTSGEVSLEAAIARRRSTRRYTPGDLSLEQIGQLLWAAQGITGGRDVLRAAPSAGGCHPLVVYVCRADGVWRYHPQGHYLARHLEQDVRDELAEAALRQWFIAEAPCVFAISAIFERTTQRYRERGQLRYVPMDTGHAAQNLLLQAVALGLVSVPVGAFDDDAVKKVLFLPKHEEALYILPVGHP
ncbi:MAG: SagB/ThcOx family dehydrogenase [Anaerolineae bacterium]